MEFDYKAFADFVLENKVIGFKEEAIKFKHGRECNCYVNWRVVINDAYLLDQVTDYVIDFVKSKNLKPRSFYGVPEGATKLGILMQYKWAKAQPDYAAGAYVAPMGRAAPKDHGAPEDKFFVGMPQGDTIVVEDTTTTGGSLLKGIDSLQEAGVKIIAAIALTNRNEVRDDGMTVAQVLEQKGIPYYALSNLKDLLPAVYDALQPSPEIRQAVKVYFEKYGAKD